MLQRYSVARFCGFWAIRPAVSEFPAEVPGQNSDLQSKRIPQHIQQGHSKNHLVGTRGKITKCRLSLNSRMRKNTKMGGECEVHWPVGQERLFFRRWKGEVVLREAKTTRAEPFSSAKDLFHARLADRARDFIVCGFDDPIN